MSRIVFLLVYLGREIYPLIVAMKRIAHTKRDGWEHARKSWTSAYVVASSRRELKFYV